MVAALTLCDDGLAHTPICVESIYSCQEVVLSPREGHEMFSLGTNKFDSAKKNRGAQTDCWSAVLLFSCQFILGMYRDGN
jgi:hypothetical protein